MSNSIIVQVVESQNEGWQSICTFANYTPQRPNNLDDFMFPGQDRQAKIFEEPWISEHSEFRASFVFLNCSPVSKTSLSANLGSTMPFQATNSSKESIYISEAIAGG